MFSFRKLSTRALLALLVFFALSYCASHFEPLVLGPAINLLKVRLHVNFHPIFGPKPAVPVNLFTVITLERSFFTLAITWIALLIAKKRWTDTGFSRDRGLRLYGAGLLSGYFSVTFLVLLMWAAGGLTFDGLRLQGADRITYPLRWLIGMLFAGFEEECGLRGFSLFTIAEIVGALPAAIISAAIFMGLHIGNPGRTSLACRKCSSLGCFAP